MVSVPVTTGEPPLVGVGFTPASELLEATVRQVPAGAWEDPSPCADWTVRDLVGHAIETTMKAAALAKGRPFSRSEEPRPGHVAAVLEAMDRDDALVPGSEIEDQS